MKIIGLLKADFLKMRHTSFYMIHILVPAIGVILFLGYYYYSPWNTVNKVNGFFETLCIAFPVLIGIVTEMVIEKEAEAGKFKEMLSVVYGKKMCLLSKVLMMMAAGLFSLFLASFGFYIGFQYILKQNSLTLDFYVLLTAVIFTAQIFIYLFHLFLSIKYGSGVSIGMGIFESLVSALFITGLGDGIWKVVPCSWAVRFCNNFFTKESGSADMFKAFGGIKYWIESSSMGIINCIVFTIMIGIALFIWFKSFEGRGEK